MVSVVILLLFNIGMEEADGNENKNRADRISRVTPIEDLQPADSLPLAPLSIKV